MLTDKDIALDLLERYEVLYRKAEALRAVIIALKVPNWEYHHAKIMIDETFLPDSRDTFQRIREQILHAPGFDEAVKELLKDLPPLSEEG